MSATETPLPEVAHDDVPVPRLRQASARGATLGTWFLGIGAFVIAGLQSLYGLGLFSLTWPIYPNVRLEMFAWLLLLTAFAAAVITISVIGDRLPTWLFLVILALLAGAVALDFAAIWELRGIGQFATASVSAGFVLLLVVTFRRAWEVIAAALALGAAFGVAIYINTPLTVASIPAQISTMALACLPPILGVIVVRGFRRMVQGELDRVLVQSTVSAPRFAVGMLASTELERLDLAAEELLDAVATGKTTLPLEPESASLAASLATELRLHLIQGRLETWLYHAVNESELLGKLVTLTDPGGLAGLMDRSQRDGLLSAVWLLVNDRARRSATRTLQLSFGPLDSEPVDGPPGKLRVPIVMTTTDVRRNRVDPATWESLGRVGLYSDTTENSSLRVTIDCFVDNPAEQ